MKRSDLVTMAALSLPPGVPIPTFEVTRMAAPCAWCRPDDRAIWNAELIDRGIDDQRNMLAIPMPPTRYFP
jgi:hypothetical protein